MADIYYYEEGYFDTQGYFVYTADAAAYFSDYFDNDYLEAGYWSDDQGTKFGISADLTEVVGQTVEASGSWTSSVSVTVQIDRIRSADASLSVTTSISADISVIGLINIDANIAASLSVDAVTNRSAQVALENLVNISLSADRTRSTTATVSSSSSISAAANTVTDTSASLSSQTIQNTVENRIRSADSTLLVLFTPSLTADAFKNHTAQLDTQASLAVSAEKITDVTVNLSHVASLSASVSRTRFIDSSQSTTASITAQGRRSSRTVTVTSFVDQVGSLTFDSNDRQYGTHSLVSVSGDSFQLLPGSAYGSTYGFLMIAQSGSSYYALRSTTGATWTTTATSGLDAGPVSLRYENGYYFAFCGDHYIRHSSDGITWTKTQIYSVNNPVNTVIYRSSNSTWYAIGSGSPFSSTNLSTWTQALTVNGLSYDAVWYGANLISATTTGIRVGNTLTRTGNFRSIATNGTTYVAVGLSGSIYATTNPAGSSASWSAQSSGTSLDILGVTYANNEFRAWAADNASTSSYRRWIYLTSSDGSTWSSISSNIIVGGLRQAGSQINNKPAYGAGNWLLNQYIALVNADVKPNSYLSSRANPYVSVADSDNWSNFKTIDFWLKYTGPFSIQRALGDPHSTNQSWQLIVTAASGTNLTLNFGGWQSDFAYYSLNASTTGQNRNNWLHFRISQNAGTISVYVNGTRYITGSVPNPLVDTNSPLLISGDYRIDELRVSNSLVTDPSVSSFTPPSQAFVNDADTTLLLHFDNNLEDDSTQTLRLAQASMSSQVTSAATATRIKGLAADLSVTSAVSALAVKNTEIVLTALGNASLTADLTKITNLSSQANAASSLSAEAVRTRDLASSQAAQSQIQVNAGIIKSADVITDAVATQLAAVAKIGDFLIASDLAANLTTDAVKTTDVSSTLAAVSSISIDVVRIKSLEATESSTAYLTATGQNTVFGSATLQSETFGQFVAVKTTDCAVVTDAMASQLAVVAKTGDFLIAMDVLSNLTATAPKTVSVTVDMASSVTILANPVLITDSSSNLSVVAAQTTVGYKAVFGQANLSLSAGMSIDASRTRSTSVTADAITTELAVVVRTGQGLIAADVQANLSAQGTRTATTTGALSSQVTVSAQCGTIKSASSTVSASSQLTALGISVITVSSTQSVSAQIVANTVKTASAQSGLSATTAETVDIARIRSGSALLSGLAAELVLGSKTTSVAAQLVVTAQVTAQGSKQTGIVATLPVIASSLTVGRDLQLSEYPTYIIPSESRSWTIREETRLYKIREETRIYTIKDE